MANKITYTPFISKPIPESLALSPIPISVPISEYQGVDPDREVIPVRYTSPKTESETKQKDEQSNPFKWSRLVLNSGSTPVQTAITSTVRRPSGSHVFKTPDIKVGNMQDFLDEAARHGVYFRVTSGVREGAATSNGNRSNHATGNAIDITPLDGQSWDELITQMKDNPELLDYMRKNGMRILDERSPEVLARTGGTGAHFHLSFGKTEGKGVDEFFV